VSSSDALPEKIPTGSRPSPPGNLPHPLTSLVGREREVAAVRELLQRDDVRLLTLTGPPGIGKTRLSIEVANALPAGFADGVYFVPLAPVTNPNLVVSAIAHTLGIRQAGDAPLLKGLTSFLSDKQMLLLLDNFEHLVPAGTSVTELLVAAPGLKVLVTSREVLHVSSEYNFPVPPLALPPLLVPQGSPAILAPLPPERLILYESVQLFVQRATALKPDFALTGENVTAVGDICRRLDGLPLTIELAATRIPHLPPQAILDRLHNRLGLLTGGARDLPARQQTLQATIEWSYDLLNSEEKTLFRHLAVFRGGRTLDAIQAVCSTGGDPQIDPLDLIASLVDKSLLRQEEGASGEPRYVMLETIHEYASARLEESGEAESIRHRHASFFLALAEQSEPELRGPRQVEWLDRLEAEHDNFRAALEWAFHDDVRLGLRLAASLSTFWIRRGYLSEGQERTLAMLSAARDSGAEPTQSSAQTLYAAGFFAFRQGDYVSAFPLLQESVETFKGLQDAGDRRGLVESLNLLGIVLSRLEGIPARRKLHEEALALATQMGDKWCVARSLYQLGHVDRLTGDYPAGQVKFEESLALFKQSGDKFNIGLALVGIGQMAERLGKYQSARAIYEESLDIFEELGDRWGISSLRYCLGYVALYQGDYAGAQSLLQANLTLTKELGIRGDTAECLEKLGRIAYYQGDYAGAHSLYQDSLVLFQDLGDTYGIARCLMDLGGVVAMVETAAKHHARGHDSSGPATPHSAVRAARLMGAAEALFERIGMKPDSMSRELFNTYVTTVRARLKGPPFAEAWTDGRAMQVEQAIAYARSTRVSHEHGAVSRPSAVSTKAGLQVNVLSRREREVASRIAQGRSNRQIASELVVTERTVEGHVSNILYKLGFHSRAQISAWVVETGLAKP
jgi:predicted ATPase/DNA-binding CsgD family transcriptional regulator